MKESVKIKVQEEFHMGWKMFSGYEQFPIISIKSLNIIEKAIKKLKKVLADNLAGNNVEIFTYKL